MRKLTESADRYIQGMDWRELAAVKFCVMAFGFLGGLALPKRARKPAALLACAVFALTYVPLMCRYLRVIFEDTED